MIDTPEECADKLESLDTSLADIKETCEGQAQNVLALTMMVQDQKEGELYDLRRDTKSDAG